MDNEIKRGRPPKYEGKQYRYLVQLPAEEVELLNDLCEYMKISKADAIRRSIVAFHTIMIKNRYDKN